ncbi:PLP-dependent aminotransferase family protein [Streptomyces sp. NPDC091972]|uniref:aminotransferase-like domain-containing protein n=1 Tax=Streptomyces sp. NPDC091972 TaxID=3366007 RepID=UPI0038252D66
MSIRENLAELCSEPLHASLAAASMESMNLLNNISGTYPEAISFAAGRPYEGFFDTDQLHEYLNVFTDYLRRERGMTDQQVSRTLFQYGDTKGVIGELIARNLAVDEGIDADPRSVVVTVGFQEALFLVLRALRADDRDALLAPSPTYVGLTGAALLTDLPVIPVPSGERGPDLAELVGQLRAARDAGRRVRACYVTPDFANPVGVSMTVVDRHRLLEIAASERLLLLEDNPYGLFHRTPDRRPPTLKSLDTEGRVVYLGSFAKSGVAGARVGFAVADQPMGDGLFADELSKIKSMLTVNTSPIAQAVIGGKLIANDFSLVAANTRETAVYHSNLAQVLDGLAKRFREGDGVSWNEPDGGFFVVVTVPFTVDDAFLDYAGREHGVLFTPMHHFFGAGTESCQLRLSISTLTPERIEEGLDRLADAVTARLPRSTPTTAGSTAPGGFGTGALS